MDRAKGKSKPPVTGTTVAFLVSLSVALGACGEGPVYVTETEIWRMQLEQMDDGSASLYPRRGTINMRLRLNRTSQPDPACDGQAFETVTTFLADVEVLPSRLQTGTTGTADGSWNCHGMATTVRLRDGTTYELRSGYARSHPEWTLYPEGALNTWTSGERRGQFLFAEGDFDGDLVESHVDVLVQNRTDREWFVVMEYPSLIRTPVEIDYRLDGTWESFAPVSPGTTANLSWPSHPARRGTGIAPLDLAFRQIRVAPEPRPHSVSSDPGITCYLAPDHPDQVQLVIDDAPRLECGSGWLGSLYLSVSRSPLFVEPDGATVRDTVDVVARGVRDLRVEGTDPRVTGEVTLDRIGQSGVLVVTVAPDAPRTEHGLRLIGESDGSDGPAGDTLFLPVHVYDLDIAPASDTLVLPRGGSDTTSILVDGEGLFGHVRYSATDVPPGVLLTPPSFDPSVGDRYAGVGSVVTVRADAEATPGAYGMTLCATLVADPEERCHAAPLVLVVEQDDAGGADVCQAFDLRLDFQPVEVAAGASDAVPIFVDRAQGFTAPVELTLEPLTDGPELNGVLSAWSLSPNPVPGIGTFSSLSFTPRPDVTPGLRFGFQVVGGSPTLDGAEETCTTTIAFRVIG